MTVPNVAPLLGQWTAEAEHSLGVVSLDAHLNCRAVEGQPSSGSPYRQLLEAGLDELAVLGARHFETSTAYAEYLRKQGGEVVAAEEVGDDPVEAADRARRVVAVELLCGAQAAEYVDDDLAHGDGTAAIYETVRRLVPPLDGDRPLAGDIDAIAAAITDGLIVERAAGNVTDGFATLDEQA